MLARAADTNNDTLAGATWTFYATGTTTPQSVYTTSALSVAHANPVVADAAGKFAPIYFDAALTYRGILKDASGTTIFDIDPINAAIASLLAASTGASLVGYKSHATGAVARTSNSKHGDSVSVFDFIASSKHPAILDGTSTADVATELQSAIDSGENLHFPGRSAAKYLIDGQLKVSTDYQKLTGFGARLDFRGTDNTKNAIELLSTRRDAGGSATRSGQSFGGFRLLGANSASYASLIFVEEGCFFPKIHDLQSDAGTNKGYFGSLVDAFIRVNGNASSYVNDVTIRDVNLHALVQNEVAGDFPDCGIWIEGCIEGRLENVKLFYFKECLRLGDAAGVSRNVQQMLFDQVQCEPTKPTDIVDDVHGVRIYQAADCTFRDCKLDPGNGAGSDNSRSVLFSPTTAASTPRNITFRDCHFQGFGNVDYAIEAEANASAYGIVIDGGTVNDFTDGIAINNGKQLQLEVTPRTQFYRIVPKRRKLQARTADFAGLTVGSGPQNNSTTVVTLSDIYVPGGTPALANVDVSSNFNFLEPYRSSAEGAWKVKAYQQTGASRAIAAGKINLRHFRPEEILAQAEFTVDYASLASGAVSTSPYTVPGAIHGITPVVATFYDGTGQEGILLEAYTTANNAVTVARFNAHSAAVDPASGTLTISVIRPVFDLVGAVSFDISTVAAGARGTTSVTIAGSEMGDGLLAWYSHDQAGLFIRPRMAANGTVNFEIINPTGSPPGSVTGTIYCGVYRKPSVI